MAYSNAAFDYESYARETSAPSKAQQPPELRVVESRKSHSRVVFRSTAAIFVVMLGIMAAILYNRMLLTELTAEVEATQEKYNMLVADERRMQVELEGKVSLRSIQQAAEELGMAKAQPDQIEYIDIATDSGEVVVRSHETPLTTLTASASEAFDRLLEYLGR